jgi:SAM-dependent methyltransferase
MFMVELVQSNIDVFRQNTAAGEQVTITQGNAMDLSAFSSNTYDITLLLGPMYHLYVENDKKAALSEAIRVTKQGGVIFVAYCISDATILTEFFNTQKLNLFEFIKEGMIDPETFATHSEPKDIIELVRKEDIYRLMNEFYVTRLHYVATDGLTHYIHDGIDCMDDTMFKQYLKYHFATCEREDMVGVSHHSLDIFKKNQT